MAFLVSFFRIPSENAYEITDSSEPDDGYCVSSGSGPSPAPFGLDSYFDFLGIAPLVIPEICALWNPKSEVASYGGLGVFVTGVTAFGVTGMGGGYLSFSKLYSGLFLGLFGDCEI
jgi:hypothetical protein